MQFVVYNKKSIIFVLNINHKNKNKMTHSQYLTMKEMVTRYEDKVKRNEIKRINKEKESVKTLSISVRLIGTLERNGIMTIDELVSCNHRQMMSMKGYGRKLHYEMKELFSEKGWELPKDPWESN